MGDYTRGLRGLLKAVLNVPSFLFQMSEFLDTVAVAV